MTDITNLLNALMGGDLTAALPIIDWLRDRQDARECWFIKEVGIYLEQHRIQSASLPGAFRAMVSNIRVMFWLELGDRSDAWDLLYKCSGIPEKAVQPPDRFVNPVIMTPLVGSAP